MSFRAFSALFMEELSGRALASERRRQHYNLHADYEDPCQRFFNAIEPNSYIRPHRHDTRQGVETLIAVRGRMALLIFDDVGRVTQVQKFGVDRLQINSDVAVVVEVRPCIWHTVLALETGSVLLEVKAGPFNPGSPKHPALWAPEESTDQVVDYLKSLRNFALSA